jgi:hypothetical protein
MSTLGNLEIKSLFNFNVHLQEDIKPVASQSKNLQDTGDFIKSVLVPRDKQIEYIVHINNRDFISRLPRVLIPKYHDTNTRAFEMNADDMHDNFHGLNFGDLVFGRKMSSPYKFTRGELYIVVTQEKVLIRRIKPAKSLLELIPDNANFSSMEISKAEVLEAWEVFGYFSKRIEAPTLVSERIMHLENQFDVLEERLKKLESRKKQE